MVILLALAFTFCGEDDTPENSADPANLTIEVVSIDQETGTVILQASADHAVQYKFFIGDADTPEEVNDTGHFEYTFAEEGQYVIEVRAYGSSGRFIRGERLITILPFVTEPVPLDSGYFTPLEYPGYTLVWQDEFNGTSVNLSDWTFQNGDGCPDNCGWGNNELEYYRSENTRVADDVLTIEARKEDYGGRNYTSSKLITSGKKSFLYGRIDIRALLPKGQGMWPALWMLGNDISTVGWPKCGEIDIMEMIGGSGRENQVHGTAHWDDGQGHASYGDSYTLASGTFADRYHVFSLIWDATTMKWYMDDHLYNVLDITPAVMSEFHQEFWLIFNVAVGGNWPGNPDNTTHFPQQMKVDYIRVFQQE